MPKKRDFLARFGERLDIPREALPGGFGLTLSGQNELSVRGCRRILEYGSECIRLSLGGTVLSITGEGLLCSFFSAETLTVCGYIRVLALEEGKDES